MLSYKNVWISRHETRDILLIKSGSKQKTNATQKGIQDNSQMVYQQLEIFLFISGDAKKSRRNISLIMRPLFIKKWKDKINGRDVLDTYLYSSQSKRWKTPCLSPKVISIWILDFKYLADFHNNLRIYVWKIFQDVTKYAADMYNGAPPRLLEALCNNCWR